MKKMNNLMLMALLFMLAMAARLIPLSNSSLPYNIDGFPLARISEMMISGGSMDPSMHRKSSGRRPDFKSAMSSRCSAGLEAEMVGCHNRSISSDLKKPDILGASTLNIDHVSPPHPPHWSQ